MKRIIVAALAVLLLLGAFIQNSYLRQFSDELSALAQEVEDSREPGEACAALREGFSKYEPSLGALIEHEELDNLSTALIALETGARSGHDISAALAQLKYYIEHIAEIDSFSLKNIF